MYRYVNLRGCENDNVVAPELFLAQNTRLPGEPANLPDNETDLVKLFFVHGLNVDAAESADWSGRLFKRLYQTGFRGRYVGVDWNGDEGLDCNYAENVENAFLSAAYLKETVDLLRENDAVIMMAHSLGNMVVSSVIRDKNLEADQFFMLNAAIASEAFDESLFQPVPENPMVPHIWRNYLPRTWFACRHSLFPPGDTHRELTWKNRFATVPLQTSIVNFYDSEDEVLEIEQTGNISWHSGFSLLSLSSTKRCLAWQKQEHFKGRWEGLWDLGYTSETGWGFEKAISVLNYMSDGSVRREYLPIQPSDANLLTDDQLRDFQQVVFCRYPSDLGNAMFYSRRINHFLGYAVPALSSPVGVTNFDGNRIPIPGEDMAGLKDGTNGWPRNRDFFLRARWLHSDFMMVPYFYTHQLFEHILSSFQIQQRINRLEYQQQEGD